MWIGLEYYVFYKVCHVVKLHHWFSIQQHVQQVEHKQLDMICIKKMLWVELKTNLTSQTLLQNRNIICQSAMLLNKYLGGATCLLAKSGKEAGRIKKKYSAFMVLIWESIWACMCLFWQHYSVNLILRSSFIPIHSWTTLGTLLTKDRTLQRLCT